MNGPTSLSPERGTKPLHLFGFAGLLVILGAFTAASTILTRRLPSSGSVSAELKLYVYAVTFVFEWLFAGYAIWQLRELNLSVGPVVHMPATAKGWLADLIVGAAFWLLWTAMAIGLAFVIRPTAARYMILLPANRIETAIWIALSITAGFCEELLFRGYLQRVLQRSTNAGAAVAAQAVIFGLVHTYQGIRNVALIMVLGLMFGLLARWRGSLWPGILVHMWIDISGVILFRG